MRSLHRSKFFLLPVALLLSAPFLLAQRGGQPDSDSSALQRKVDEIAKPTRKPTAPPPRAVAVLEWVPKQATPAAASPGPKLLVSDPNAKASSASHLPQATAQAPTKDDPPSQARLIPVSIYYQGAFQDAAVFLSQPAPLALQADTVYALETSGDAAGTFTLHGASKVQQGWIGIGDFQPIPPPRPFKPNVNLALGPRIDDEEEESGDRPILRRRHPEDASTSKPTESSPSPDSASKPVGSDDPDRPTLKRHDASTAPAASSPADTAPVGSDDPDRPTLHRAPASSPSAATTTQPAPATSTADRKTSDDYLNPADDPLRPHIKPGIYKQANAALPSLLSDLGDLRQTVAVSDAANTDEHSFSHTWMDAAEKSRARQAMQQLALTEIAKWLKSLPAPPASKPAAPPGKHSGSKAAARPHAPGNAPEDAPDLSDTQFAAFDLAYQDEPTYVFAAQSSDPGLQQIFVCIVARPDIYGNLQVTFSAVTNGAELELTPRYRLVDAVDAKGDGRAELLLEARNLDGRRFVLLDVYRGEATKVFETGLTP